MQQQWRRSGKTEKQDKTQFITKIDGFPSFTPLECHVLFSGSGKNEKQDKTQCITKIDGFSSFTPMYFFQAQEKMTNKIKLSLSPKLKNMLL